MPQSATLIRLPPLPDFSNFLGWGETEFTSYVGHNWPVVPARDDDECGSVGGMRICRGNPSTRRKPAPQIPQDLASDWTRAAAVESGRLTVWARARPCHTLITQHNTVTCVTHETLDRYSWCIYDVGFHGPSLLVLILVLGLCIVGMWEVLHTFRKYILFSYSGSTYFCCTSCLAKVELSYVSAAIGLVPQEHRPCLRREGEMTWE
jgi:hypothetical protein